MQKYIFKKTKVLYALLIFLIINLYPNVSLAKDIDKDLLDISKENTVSVGCWYFNNLKASESTSNNAYAGFINEYLQKISETTGLKFKNKPMTLNESLKYLEDGKIDLVAGIIYTSERASKYDYIRPAMSTCNVSVFVKKSKFKPNLKKSDLTIFKGKTIGTLDTLKGYCFETLKSENYDTLGTEFKYYSDFSKLKQALIKGEVDYTIEVSPLIDMTGIEEVFKLKQASLYLITQKNNTKLNNKINTGLFNLAKENRYFKEQLFYKYISIKQQVDFLTPKERIALEKTDKLTFYVRDNRNAIYSKKLKDDIAGYYSNYIAKISKILNKDYQIIQVNKEQLAKSDVPGFFCAINTRQGRLINNKEAIYADYVTDLISSPTRYSLKLICVAKGTTSLGDNAIYASSNDVIVAKYRALGNRVSFTKNAVDALKLLKEGKVDAAIVDIVMTGYVNSYSDYNGIEILDFEEPVEQVMMGIKGVDKNLFSAVNRAITLLPIRETRAYTFDRNREFVYKPTIWEKISEYSTVFIFLGLLILIGLIVFIRILIKKNSKINKLALKADGANRTKIDFLSRISHEMRTPLNAIISYAKFGLAKENESKIKEYFKKIEYSSETLLDLMEESLELESLKYEENEHKKIITLEEFIKKIESIIYPLADAKKIKFESINAYSKNLTETKVYVKVNELALQQILLNLLTNAIKYTKPGGKVIWKKKIKLLLNNKVLVEHEIKDNGVGMSEEFQKHMFEEFSMEENELSETEIGTGLGLALCKKVTDKIGSELTWTSKLGVGTTFFLKTSANLATKKEIKAYKAEKCLTKTFKIEDPFQKEQSHTFESKGINKTKRTLKAINDKKLKILICEDILINKKIVEKILINNEMKVDWAKNGEIGVLMAKQEKYDLIIMDIRMPVMDGLTAAKLIRANDSKIPIIALSANVYESDVEKSFEAGMNAHLGKPIDAKKLLTTIYRLTNIV